MKQLIRKTLLALIGGVMCNAAWADVIETVGKTDKTSEYVNSNTDITIKQGETKVITFNNYGSTGQSYYNWTIVAKEGSTEKFSVRADSWDNTSAAATNITSYKVATARGGDKGWLDWDTFKDDMQNASCVAAITYGTDGTLALRTTSECSTGNIYYVDHNATGLSGNDVSIIFYVERSYLEITSISTAMPLVGAIDYTTGFMGEHKDFTISKGEALKLNFQNHGIGGTESQWFNWLVRLSGTTGVDQTLRADNYVLGDGESTVSTRSITQDGGVIDWPTFCDAMKNASVEMTITYTAEGMFSILVTATGNTHTFVHNFAYKAAKDGDITIELGVEKAWLELLSAGANQLVTLSAIDWATFVSDYPLDFTGSEVKAYVVTGASGSAITKEAVTTVAANTPLLLNAPAETYAIPVATTGNNYSTTNKLVAGTGEAVAYDANSGYNYVLSIDNGKAMFMQIVDGTPATIPVGKAYLALDAAPARGLNLFDDEETTGVNEVKTQKVAGEYFNLAGQRVANPTKGLYIVNGKKVIIK